MKNKRQKGFSLVEIILSVAVLSIVSVYIIKMFILSAEVNEKAVVLDKSVEVSEIAMQRVSQEGLNDYIKTYYPAKTSEQGVFKIYFDDTWKDTQLVDAHYLMSIQEETLDNEKHYTITISRLERDGEQVIYELQSKIYK